MPTTPPPRRRSTTLNVATIEHPLPPEQASGTSTTPSRTRVLPTRATPAWGASGAGGDGATGPGLGARVQGGRGLGGVGHGPPPAPSLTRKLESDTTARPLHDTASASVVQVPHASGNVIQACGPPESSRRTFENGSCGKSPETAVNWPVSGSSSSSHGSLTISPGTSATR